METTIILGVTLGIYWDNEKEITTYSGLYWVYIGVMEKKMETTIILGVLALQAWSKAALSHSSSCCRRSWSKGIRVVKTPKP